MPLLHLIPRGSERWEMVVQGDGQSFPEAQALALTRGAVCIPADAVGSMLSHPSFRQRFADCIIHR